MQFIYIILFVTSFLGYCLFANRRLRLPLETTPFFSASAIISSLYAFGYLGSLSFNRFGIPTGYCDEIKPQIAFLLFGAYAIYFLGFTFLLLWFRDTRGRSGERVAALASPTVIIFAAATVFSVLYCRHYILAYNDELAIWGMNVKDLFCTNAFAGSYSPIMFPSYMPGCALFQYYFLKFTGMTEGNMYASQLLMIILAMLPALRGATWKNLIGIIAVPFVTVAAVYYYRGQFINLGVDVVLSVWIAAGILAYLSLSGKADRSEHPLARFGMLIPCLFSLTLLKQPGFHFSIMIIGIVIASESLTLVKTLGCRHILAECWKLVAKVSRRKIAIGTIAALLLIGAPFTAKYSWIFRLKSLDIPISFQSDAETGKFLKSLKRMNEAMFCLKWPFALISEPAREEFRAAIQASFLPREIKIARHFIEEVVRLEIYHMAVFSFLGILLTIPAAKSGRSLCQGICALILPLGFLAFALGLMISYMYSFGDYDAFNLLSLERYLSIYLLGWTLVLFYFAALNHWTNHGISSARDSRPRVLLPINGTSMREFFSHFSLQRIWANRPSLDTVFFYVATLAAVAFFPLDYYRNDVWHIWFVSERWKSRSIAESVLPHLENEQKTRIYCIWQQSVGLEFYDLKYDLYPFHMQFWDWSLGKPYYEGDIWTKDITPQEWIALLKAKDFSHLLLAQADDRFWKIFGHLFEQDARLINCHLYKIAPDDSLGVKFIAVYRDPQPQVEWNRPVELSRSQSKFATSGWSCIEPAGFWTGKQPAEIAFSISETISCDCKVTLTASPNPASNGPAPKVDLSVNLEPVGELEVAKEAEYELVIPAKFFENGNRDITLSLAPSNPQDFSDEKPTVNNPSRRIFVKSFRISKDTSPTSKNP